MSTSSRPRDPGPPFGPHTCTTHCSRITGVTPRGHTFCGEAPTYHVIWNDDLENGVVCTRHAAEAQKWLPRQIHEIAPDCGMPGSVWIEDEKTCRVPHEWNPDLALALELLEPVSVGG